MRFTYTEAQLNFLRKHYPAMTVAELTAAFNKRYKLSKSETQIIACTKNHSIRNGRKANPKNQGPKLLTGAQVRYLIKMYPILSRKEVTAALNKKFATAFTQQQIISFCKNHGIKSGRTGHYTTGHASWNRGVKGSIPASKTSFKKGDIPKNRNPLGHERICKKDGYIWIKIAGTNPYTGYNGRYVQKHRYVWEQKNGKIPRNKVLNFIDGNRLNCDPENLELITRAELAQFNKHQLNTQPIEIRPALRTAIKITAKIKELEKS